MFKVLFSLFANLGELDEQVVQMRRHFEAANAFLDNKVGPIDEGGAAPAIEDRTSKNGHGRKTAVK